MIKRDTAWPLDKCFGGAGEGGRWEGGGGGGDKGIPEDHATRCCTLAQPHRISILDELPRTKKCGKRGRVV